MGQNYFNTLPLRLQLEELGKCRFMHRQSSPMACDYLRAKNCHRRLWCPGPEPGPQPARLWPGRVLHPA